MAEPKEGNGEDAEDVSVQEDEDDRVVDFDNPSEDAPAVVDEETEEAGTGVLRTLEEEDSNAIDGANEEEAKEETEVPEEKPTAQRDTRTPMSDAQPIPEEGLEDAIPGGASHQLPRTPLGIAPTEEEPMTEPTDEAEPNEQTEPTDAVEEVVTADAVAEERLPSEEPTEIEGTVAETVAAVETEAGQSRPATTAETDEKERPASVHSVAQSTTSEAVKKDVPPVPVITEIASCQQSAHSQSPSPKKSPNVPRLDLGKCSEPATATSTKPTIALPPPPPPPQQPQPQPPEVASKVVTESKTPQPVETAPPEPTPKTLEPTIEIAPSAAKPKTPARAQATVASPKKPAPEASSRQQKPTAETTPMNTKPMSPVKATAVPTSPRKAPTTVIVSAKGAAPVSAPIAATTSQPSSPTKTPVVVVAKSTADSATAVAEAAASAVAKKPRPSAAERRAAAKKLKEDAAATKIQSAFRGHVARRQYREMRLNSAASPAEPQHESISSRVAPEDESGVVLAGAKSPQDDKPTPELSMTHRSDNLREMIHSRHSSRGGSGNQKSTAAEALQQGALGLVVVGTAAKIMPEDSVSDVGSGSGGDAFLPAVPLSPRKKATSGPVTTATKIPSPARPPVRSVVTPLKLHHLSPSKRPCKTADTNIPKFGLFDEQAPSQAQSQAASPLSSTLPAPPKQQLSQTKPPPTRPIENAFDHVIVEKKPSPPPPQPEPEPEEVHSPAAQSPPPIAAAATAGAATITASASSTHSTASLLKKEIATLKQELAKQRIAMQQQQQQAALATANEIRSLREDFAKLEQARQTAEKNERAAVKEIRALKDRCDRLEAAMAEAAAIRNSSVPALQMPPQAPLPQISPGRVSGIKKPQVFTGLPHAPTPK